MYPYANMDLIGAELTRKHSRFSSRDYIRLIFEEHNDLELPLGTRIWHLRRKPFSETVVKQWHHPSRIEQAMAAFVSDVPNGN